MNHEKTPQKVGYLSRIFLLTAQQPKWQNSCSQIWPTEQLYIELGWQYIFHAHLLILVDKWIFSGYADEHEY